MKFQLLTTVVHAFVFVVSDIEVENCDLLGLDLETRAIIEADSFWCTSRLLDGIQDNYTFAQPGIQMKVNALRELIKRIDGRVGFCVLFTAVTARLFSCTVQST